MIRFSSDIIREFCKDVLEVRYIKYSWYWKESKYKPNSEKAFLDLECMFKFNQLSKDSLYMRIKTDWKGRKYAELTEEGTKYAIDNDLSFMNDECKKRNSRNVLLNKKIRIADSLCPEDRLCKRLDRELHRADYNFPKLEYSTVSNGNSKRPKKQEDAFPKDYASSLEILISCKDSMN